MSSAPHSTRSARWSTASCNECSASLTASWLAHPSSRSTNPCNAARSSVRTSCPGVVLLELVGAVDRRPDGELGGFDEMGEVVPPTSKILVVFVVLARSGVLDQLLSGSDERVGL